ncbi:Dehydrogenase [Oopsacas minuta]|uniref:Trans-1,2-dihydrobenzene-1,2-diol dehydrogenase n=1 Tax=Oopsacas minuta TaxID=111878 RepID=A0AAV7JT78_9METZ|nr:Dehydrogenase [Oopsacas minuta]
MASQLVATSTETAPDQSFIFTPITATNEDILSEKSTAELLNKWGLTHSLFKSTFSFDKLYKEYQSEKIVRDFFTDSSNFMFFHSPPGKSINLNVDTLKIIPMTCTVTNMDFFDRLYVESSAEGPGLVKKSGNICGCFEEMFYGMYIGDELRKMFVSDESDQLGIFSESEMDEFIYNLLKLVCLGGTVNQYEDTLQPYLEVVLQLYRNLITVVKDPISEEIRTSSLVYTVTGYNQDKLIFPSNHVHPQNCLACIMKLKWGILSAGKISHDFVSALKALPSAEHQVVAVAARNEKSAQEFATFHTIPKFYGGYQSLYADEEVQIVYIGVTNPQHLECVKQALVHKKHVLCEKPLGINCREVEEMVTTASANKVFFMEAVWTRFIPSTNALREELISGSIGEIRYIHAEFGIHPIPLPARMSDPDLGGGSILDLGVYVVNLTSMVMGNKRPSKISVSGSRNDKGVDESAYFTLEYPGDVVAQLACSAVVQMNNTLSVYGSKGYLRLATPFHASDKLETSDGVREFPFPQSDAKYNFRNSVALCYEAVHCRECIMQGKTESPIMPLEDSWVVCGILDEARKQLSVKYPQDI